MQITLNGEPRDLTGSYTIIDLLEELGYVNKRLAVEVNGDIVPKSEHARTAIQDGDQIEIVIAVGGG